MTDPEIIRTADGSLTLAHPLHGEAYHSRQGARFEATELYIRGSGIETQLATGRDLTVLDVGLGLGYNALVTIDAWLATPSPGALRLVSLEIEGALVDALAQGSAAWQAGWPEAWLAACRSLRAVDGELWRGVYEHPCGARLHWDVAVRDMRREPLPPRASGLDYVWQDPFSPSRNPELWTASWFERLIHRATPDCMLMTYSVARTVRDALSEAGWVPERFEAKGTAKRHWLKARPYRESSPD